MRMLFTYLLHYPKKTNKKNKSKRLLNQVCERCGRERRRYIIAITRIEQKNNIRTIPATVVQRVFSPMNNKSCTFV